MVEWFSVTCGLERKALALNLSKASDNHRNRFQVYFQVHLIFTLSGKWHIVYSPFFFGFQWD